MAGPGDALSGESQKWALLESYFAFSFSVRMMIFLLERVAGPLDREMKAEMNEETDP